MDWGFITVKLEPLRLALFTSRPLPHHRQVVSRDHPPATSIWTHYREQGKIRVEQLTFRPFDHHGQVVAGDDHPLAGQLLC